MARRGARTDESSRCFAMSFESRELSVESGQPTEIYLFVTGSESYRYTSDAASIVYATRTYEPRQISRSGIEHDTGEAKSDLEITLPTEDDVASRFIGIVPGKIMLVTILSLHRNESDPFLFFHGAVTGASFSKQGAICTLKCQTREAAFSRPIPRYKYQGLCNHVLYDSGCKVVKSSFQFDSTVSAVSGNTITVTGLSGEGADWALGGYVKFGGDYRLVVSQSGNDVTMLLPFSEDVDGEAVSVYAGCDHSFDTCGTKFSDKINYSGCPYVPLYNVFEVGLD